MRQKEEAANGPPTTAFENTRSIMHNK